MYFKNVWSFELITLLNEIGKLLFFSCIAYVGIKAIRARAFFYTRKLSVGDIYYLSLFSVVTGFFLYVDNSLLSFFVSFVVSLLIMTYCVDAGLCSTYKMPLNPSTFKMSYHNRTALKDSILPFLSSQWKLFSYLFLLILMFWSCFFFKLEQSMLPLSLLTAVILFCIIIVTKSKINYLSFFAWLVAYVALFALFRFASTIPAFEKTASIILMVAGLFAIIYPLIVLVFRFNRKSNIRTVFFSDTIEIAEHKLSDKDQYVVDSCRWQFQPSSLHGKLAGCNVVFINFESLGLNHLQCFNPDKAGLAVSPLIDRLIDRSIFSERHFCLEPTTFSAMRNLYSSNFNEEGISQYITSLNHGGYESVALHLYNDPRAKKIYEKIGFKHVFLKDEVVSQKPDDYRMIDFVDQLKPIVEYKPFFLHILNGNTHSSYRVNDQETYARHSNKTQIGRYYNGIEECSQIFLEMLNKLYQFSPPEKTIVVVIGDHGESFGFLNYRSHNSAVTNDQILSPFLIHHPFLEKRQIPFSTHHDVLPTLFDLLGKKVSDGNMGTTALGEYPNQFAFITSTIRSDKFPVSFGFFHENRKYLVDFLNSYFYLLDENDEILETLTGEKKAYVLSFLAQGLAARGLI